MDANTPRSPSGTFGHTYTHPTNYPSPAKSEGDQTTFMPDPLGVYYGALPMHSHSIQTAQGLYPLSPQPSETWTTCLTTNASPAIMDNGMRAWTDQYPPVGRSHMASWDQPQYQYATPGYIDGRHSPDPSDPYMSHRSSVSSTYDHSVYSHDTPDSFAPRIKAEPMDHWTSDDEGRQSMTVSPEHMEAGYAAGQPYQGVKNEEAFDEGYAMTARDSSGRINTSTARTRSRNATTFENAKYECDLCGKLFQRLYNHKSHMETHDPKRAFPHICEAKGCERKFVRRTDLVRHEQSVHIKARNHKCMACGAHFARKDTLRRHTEDGCPKRFEISRQTQRTTDSSSRGRSSLATGRRSNHTTSAIFDAHQQAVAATANRMQPIFSQQQQQ
ncbi:uncharacterized protein J3D65DRAFT_621159 [Phyllosticta citribraziliensis]|uniref:C2H2-type domain-containing protein n=1 Tax=Phyllosticta citribraziliensis TaxID=989973 RepID=A0ABR1LUE9_9PEZI